MTACYQGMTIAFDFSIEEIWPTWAVGATLVAGPNDRRRLGAELADFLDRARITVLYCVRPCWRHRPGRARIRSLLVGGEACPAQLVERWSRPGRRMLNTYGPTEATVTATWGELRPGRPVTIGRPLPTYTVLILDERGEPVAAGAVGEICIGGPGVARGYVGRPDLTAERFITHPLAPAGGPLYRTGDLGGSTADGEIEYLGRADAEVKIRGHRVDLGEIESVLLEDRGVAEAVAAMVTVAGARRGPGTRRLRRAARPRPRTGRRCCSARLSRPPAAAPSRLHGAGLSRRRRRAADDAERQGRPHPAADARPDRGCRRAGRWCRAAGEPEAAGPRGLGEVLRRRGRGLSVERGLLHRPRRALAARGEVVSALRPAGTAPARRCATCTPTRPSGASPRHLDAAPAAGGQHPGPAALRPARRRIAAAGGAQAVVIYGLLLLVTLPVSSSTPATTVERLGQVLTQLMMAVLFSYLGVRWVGAAPAGPAAERRGPAGPVPSLGRDLPPALDRRTCCWRSVRSRCSAVPR